jgi:hypothetical protein
MDALARAAEDALFAHPHPALRLGELTRLVAGPVDRQLTCERLRAVLETYPGRFRIIEPWHQRWPTIAETPPRSSEDAWVVSSVERTAETQQHQPCFRLRESVRWLGRALDGRSCLEVARWYAIIRSEREARAAITRLGLAARAQSNVRV